MNVGKPTFVNMCRVASPLVLETLILNAHATCVCVYVKQRVLLCLTVAGEVGLLASTISSNVLVMQIVVECIMLTVELCL